MIKICQIRSATIKEDTNNIIILTQQNTIMYVLLNYKNCKKLEEIYHEYNKFNKIRYYIQLNKN